MKYAVIVTGGKQYKVQEGDIVTLDRIHEDVTNSITFPEVLLYVDEKDSQIGNPTVADMVVTGKVLEHAKGKKIRVAKFKAKARYRRVRGFRSYLTKVQIETIGKAEKKTKKTEKTEE